MGKSLVSCFFLDTVYVLALHVAVYDKNQACIREVEESLECFGVYPQIIRIAVWDDARLTSRNLYEEIGDVEEQEVLDLMHTGFFIHA